MMVKDEARVLFSPTQLSEIINTYPNHRFVVQSSNRRTFRNTEYTKLGIEVCDDVSFADLFLGIKQVPLNQLISGKFYFFFSHTTKRQPHNRWYLEGLQKSGITFYDYENLVDSKGQRLVAFGKIAGQLGAYHGLRTYLLKNEGFQLNTPSPSQKIEDLLNQAKNQNYHNCKIVITGSGNVGQGASLFLSASGFHKLSPKDFLTYKGKEAVFTMLSKKHYLKNEKGIFDEDEFLEKPSTYKSQFFQYAKKANLYIVGHYYHEGMPLLLTKEALANSQLTINTIADISCDVHQPLPSCLRSSTSESPIYGYHKKQHTECDFRDKSAIAVMAIDNLPSELPKRSSIQFGDQFNEHILPLILRAKQQDNFDSILNRARIIKQGRFTKRYQYLQEFVAL